MPKHKMYEMYLNNSPFLLTKQGTKTVELRLNDEKRRLLCEGDLIRFININTKETLIVKVKKLVCFNNFEELYKNYTPIEMGYNENDIVSHEDTEEYYTLEQQELYGVVAIEINLEQGNKYEK